MNAILHNLYVRYLTPALSVLGEGDFITPLPSHGGDLTPLILKGEFSYKSTNITSCSATNKPRLTK